MNHCPKHPKYKGDRVIKRLEKCEGCRAVREAWLAGLKKRKNKGKGGQFSITSPNFRCGIVHLMAEVGTVILFGPQPAFFWRKGVQADPRAKKHYGKIYSLLQNKFAREPDVAKTLSNILWLAWENDWHKISRDKEHQLSIELEKSSEKTEEKVPDKTYLNQVHINPLTLGGLLDGEEEEEEGRSF